MFIVCLHCCHMKVYLTGFTTLNDNNALRLSVNTYPIAHTISICLFNFCFAAWYKAHIIVTFSSLSCLYRLC